jgi:hypothetical protein
MDAVLVGLDVRTDGDDRPPLKRSREPGLCRHAFAIGEETANVQPPI